VVPVGHTIILEEDKYSEYEYFSLDTLPVRSEIHRMEHDWIDFITDVREPVLVPEYTHSSKGVYAADGISSNSVSKNILGDVNSEDNKGDLSENPQSSQSSDSSFTKGAQTRPVNILAWTTTPWTIPMHMALAVNKDLQYVAVYHAEEVYILADSRVETVFKGKGDYQVLCTIPGDELVGLTYKAPFDCYQNNKAERINNKEGLENSFKVYHADFVTDTDGTGIAHEAPEFGDVDYQLAKEK